MTTSSTFWKTFEQYELATKWGTIRWSGHLKTFALEVWNGAVATWLELAKYVPLANLVLDYYDFTGTLREDECTALRTAWNRGVTDGWLQPTHIEAYHELLAFCCRASGTICKATIGITLRSRHAHGHSNYPLDWLSHFPMMTHLSIHLQSSLDSEVVTDWPAQLTLAAPQLRHLTVHAKAPSRDAVDTLFALLPALETRSFVCET
jgi:hypothetical protein